MKGLRTLEFLLKARETASFVVTIFFGNLAIRSNGLPTDLLVRLAGAIRN